MSLDSIQFTDPTVKGSLVTIVEALIPTNIVLYGSNGTGKTMVANQIAKDLGLADMECEFDHTSYSKDIMMATLNTQRMVTGLRGIIIINEVDRLKPEKQYEIQNFVDTFCTDTNEKPALCNVILTTNNLTDLVPALVSRCSKYPIVGPTPVQLLPMFISRLKGEGVLITQTDALGLLVTALGHGCSQLSYRDVAALFTTTVYKMKQMTVKW
tara:strand:- start:5 stop:640 length:636 start_codon:yes stop_codon:yes gene_type:complete